MLFHTKFCVPKRKVSLLTSVQLKIYNEVLYINLYIHRTWSHCIFDSTEKLFIIKRRRKVKCTVVQALRFCTGRKAQRVGRSIALLFLYHGTEGGEGSTPLPDRFTARERPGTHCTGGWVGPRAILDWCGKSLSHRDSIAGPSSPQPVAMPATLLGPL